MKRGSEILVLAASALALSMAAASAPQRAATATAVAPESAPAPSSIPPPNDEPCAALVERVTARLGTADEALGAAERDALFHDARAVGRLHGSEEADACRTSAFTALRSRVRCGRAEAAVAGGLVGASTAKPAEIRALVEDALPGCAATFAEAAAFAADVDASLAKSLLARAQIDPDEAVRRSAWLAYGSVAEIASRTGHDEVRSEVEKTISIELATSVARGKVGAERRLLAVRTAGNAGCRPCLSALLTAANDRDGDLRRNALAALRFHEDESAARRMCRAVERDGDTSVRELSAWALSFRPTSAAVRVPCLYRAAVTDPSARVRMSATQSLGGLADELMLAHAALVQLTGDDVPADVRAFALRLLATDPAHGRREIDEAEIASLLASASAEIALP